MLSLEGNRLRGKYKWPEVLFSSMLIIRRSCPVDARTRDRVIRKLTRQYIFISRYIHFAPLPQVLFPPQLGNLSELKQLYLNRNELTGISFLNPADA